MWDDACKAIGELWHLGPFSGTLRPPSSFLFIEVVAIVIAIICLRHAWKTGRSVKPSKLRPFFMMLAVAIFTFIAEYSLSHPSEGIDSIYCYPEDWLILVAGVPIWIPLGWAWIGYLAVCTSRKLGMSWVHSPLMNGFLALTVDFLLDPIAVLEGWWVWDEAGRSLFFDIPVSNFMAWFVIVWSFTFAAQILNRWLPEGQGVRRDLAVPLLSILPAFGAVLVYKKISDAMVAARDLEPGQLFPWWTNGVVICSVIWAICAYFVFREIYRFPRDKPLDKVVFYVPLSFFTLLIGFLVYNLLKDFARSGVDGYNEYASLAVFMPAMATIGMVLFGWPYLDAILRRPRWRWTERLINL